MLAARLMPKVPSPVIDEMVTVRVVVPDPETAAEPSASPVLLRVTSPLARVTASASV